MPKITHPTPSMSSRALGGFLLVLTVLSLRTTQAQTFMDNVRHFRLILHSIQDSHKFTDVDRQFTLTMTNNENVATRASAINILVAACHNNLYSSKDLAKMLEEKAIATQRIEPILYLRYYAVLVGMRTATENRYSRQWDNIKAVGEPADALLPDEKAFVSEVMSLPNPNDAERGGELLAMKRGMNAASASWAKDKVEGEIKRSSGNCRKWWMFVQRVVTARNPPASVHTSGR